MARAFRLGVATETAPGHDLLRHRLTIPYKSPAGVLAITGRVLPPHHSDQKYLPAAPGQRKLLFNVQDMHRPEPYLAICEGELDAVLMSGTLGIPAVGIPGVSTWASKPHLPRCFAGYERIFVVADHDVREDGRSPGLELARGIMAALDNTQLVLPPAGLDLGEWHMQDGPDIIKKAMGV